MRCLMRLFVLWSLSLCMVLPVFAQGLPTIEKKTAGWDRQDGFLPVYWDENSGTVWLEIPRLDEDFLYFSSLPAGLGSNDIGLDRGQLRGEQVVRFERIGNKVLLVVPNLRYRAESDLAAERRAVQDAFAEGTLWGFTIAAQTQGRVLVDATDFIVRDVHGVVRALRQSNQGTFSLEKSRSMPYPAMIKAFPNNTEIEARLTFTGDNPGGYVREVAAEPTAFTVRVRHSFVKLPPPGYKPRVNDPRSGYFGLTYRDYAAPIGQDMTRRYIARHRLEKKDPNAAMSEAVEPIVYYLDPGTPEPVRSALLDGARWWAEAFEAAGFRDAFRVEMLPEGADPLDVRYNTIQWVHRSTRGWSYGTTVSDPRTGEIIKGHVSLGSLRVRQDYLLAEGLLAPYDDAHADSFLPEEDPMLAMALARIRQLSAHEVGHTLGLNHNFAASVNDRASVMDYPAPLAELSESPGHPISLQRAYDTGIGVWDKVTIRYGYSDFAEGVDEEAALETILEEAWADGLHYITDTDARPAGAAHPLANLWDNGPVVDVLEKEMVVREVALSRFGQQVIRRGQPLAVMEEVLVPLYLRHRYQVEATVKLLGGVTYTYALRGDGQPLPEPVVAASQYDALEALLDTVKPEALRLPDNVRTLIPPRPPEYPSHRELFPGYTGLTFDPYAPAEVAASMVLRLLIHPERAARLVYQHDFDERLPGLIDVLDRISREIWQEEAATDAYDAELERIVQQVWVDELIAVAADDQQAAAVRARITQHLRTMQDWLRRYPGDRGDDETLAHRASIIDQLDRFLLRLYQPGEGHEAMPPPPGAPIGQTSMDFLERHHQRHAFLETWSSAHAVCGF